MNPWLDGEGRFFNNQPQVSRVPLMAGHSCVVIDGVLANPHGLRAWAAEQAFTPPVGYPYPGLVSEAPTALGAHMADAFSQHARQPLGGRRTLDWTLRFSLVSTPPQALRPLQWLCHRDRVADEGSGILFAASVLYLFEDASLGGTSFYRPLQSPAHTEALVADSQTLAAREFSARYGLQASYMGGSNAYFEHVAQMPAAFNRLIVYDGGLFHSADVAKPSRMVAHPLAGRLTLNGFFTCRQNAR
jgi:Family of unknown function (DUF6445)